jgi:hypothetical protein
MAAVAADDRVPLHARKCVRFVFWVRTIEDDDHGMPSFMRVMTSLIDDGRRRDVEMVAGRITEDLQRETLNIGGAGQH